VDPGVDQEDVGRGCHSVGRFRMQSNNN
jgi:hypothetical protein